MSGLSCCGRVILVLINMIFQCFGFVWLALGLMLIFGLSLLQSYLPIDINSFLDTLPELTSGIGFTNAVNTTASGGDSSSVIDLPGLLRSIAIALAVLGAFMLIAGSCGCCGGCCAVKCMLIIYIVITGLVVAGEFTLIALLYTGVIKDEIREKMNETLISDYGGISDFSTWGLTWNLMMSFLSCCGIDNYHDFDYAEKWQSERSFTFQGYTANYTMITPVACCKLDGSFPSVTPLDTNCTLAPRDNASNWNNGCWSEINNLALDQETIFISVISGLLAFEAICVGIAICVLIMTWQDDRAKNNQVGVDDSSVCSDDMSIHIYQNQTKMKKSYQDTDF